ncbi:MAG: hypothetical protein IJK19_01985 [Bacteroidales bacterium]|nr:hypothetical protein [Bacteroidales bacterium]MBR7026688.1 hypothetical protein [Bacteroidales bacterium]
MNLRVLKKDIEFLMNDFVSDCLLYNDFSEGKKEEQVVGLIREGLALSDNLQARVNFPKKAVANAKGVEKFVRKEGKEIKAHYKDIQKDLYEGYDKLFEKLSAVIK